MKHDNLGTIRVEDNKTCSVTHSYAGFRVADLTPEQAASVKWLIQTAFDQGYKDGSGDTAHTVRETLRKLVPDPA